MDTVPISRTGRITRLIVIAVVAVIAVTICFWRCSGGSYVNATPEVADTCAQKSGLADTAAPESKSSIDMDLVNITNSITREFDTEDPFISRMLQLQVDIFHLF